MIDLDRALKRIKQQGKLLILDLDRGVNRSRNWHGTFEEEV